MDAMPIASVPPPRNEPVRVYAPGSPDRAALAAAVAEVAAQAPRPLPMHVAGLERQGSGAPFDVRAPHDRRRVLGSGREAEPADVAAAVDAALAAAPGWAAAGPQARAAVFLRAADLLAGPWRDRMNAATIWGQSKSVHQAEIDAACELADFWRWNAWFAERLGDEQPVSPPGAWNRLELRPLEGFVLAITPFNFTSIAGNLPTAPALMGNAVVWKPSPTQQLSATVTMELLEAAGLPAGVVNMVTGSGDAVSAVALRHRALAGVHFTGSTGTFRHLWRAVAEGLDGYATYPRLVGETGGKDFVLAHPSADVDALLVGLLRGAFEYQGQKCSAASRAYVPRSTWARLRGPLAEATESITMGDVSDLTTFLGAVIDGRAHDRLAAVLDAARTDPGLRLVAGGECDSAEGWFVRPTIYETADPRHD
ncbi:MAG TPA: aldehyde dehydrogenase family protein, partial [Candidatus Dormibacteraeota bacterium]|nr:aldehyde dehydrogenase family protein [Candidatus Dormibacteraeota bacterium]